jgi:hypothetical protein
MSSLPPGSRTSLDYFTLQESHILSEFTDDVILNLNVLLINEIGEKTEYNATVEGKQSVLEALTSPNRILPDKSMIEVENLFIELKEDGTAIIHFETIEPHIIDNVEYKYKFKGYYETIFSESQDKIKTITLYNERRIV